MTIWPFTYLQQMTTGKQIVCCSALGILGVLAGFILILVVGYVYVTGERVTLTNASSQKIKNIRVSVCGDLCEIADLSVGESVSCTLRATADSCISLSFRTLSSTSSVSLDSYVTRHSGGMSHVIIEDNEVRLMRHETLRVMPLPVADRQ